MEGARPKVSRSVKRQSAFPSRQWGFGPEMDTFSRKVSRSVQFAVPRDSHRAFQRLFLTQHDLAVKPIHLSRLKILVAQFAIRATEQGDAEGFIETIQVFKTPIELGSHKRIDGSGRQFGKAL